MFKFSHLLFITVFFLSACNMSRVVVSGKLQRITGNNMPSPDLPAEEPPGFAGEVYFFEPTSASNAGGSGLSGTYSMLGKQPLAVAVADSLGQFKLRLKPGKYSVLIGHNGFFYSNITDMDGTINPFTVVRKVRPLLLRADWDAVY